MSIRFLGVIAAIAVSLIVSGCASNSLAKYQGADAGFAVFSYARQKDAPYRSYAFRYRTRDHKQDGYSVWITDGILFQKDPDVNYGSQSAFVDVIRLPPGDYEIYDFDVHQGSYPAEVTYSAQKEFSIPFSVHAGETVYLGEFLAIATKGKNIFGITVDGPPYFVLSDQNARDLGIAKGKQPAINTVRVAVPNADTLGLAFVRSKPLPQ